MAYQTIVRKAVATRDLTGKINGRLIELGSARDGWTKFLNNSQVYLTTILPGKRKGFHLHHKKENQITCIQGKVSLGVWDGKKVTQFRLTAQKPQTVRIPKKHAVCFVNRGKETALVINLCSPPYNPQDPEQEDLEIKWRPK